MNNFIMKEVFLSFKGHSQNIKRAHTNGLLKCCSNNIEQFVGNAFLSEFVVF